MNFLIGQTLFLKGHMYRVLSKAPGLIVLQLRARQVSGPGVWKIEPNGYVASFPVRLVEEALTLARSPSGA